MISHTLSFSALLLLLLVTTPATAQSPTPTPLTRPQLLALRRTCQNTCMRTRFLLRKTCSALPCIPTPCRARRTNRQGFRCLRRRQRLQTPTPALPTPEQTPEPSAIPRLDDILLCASTTRPRLLLLAVRAVTEDAAGQIVSAPIVFRSYGRSGRERARREREVQCLRSGRRGFTEKDAVWLAGQSSDVACRPQVDCVVDVIGGGGCLCTAVPVCSIAALDIAIDRKC